MTFEAIHSSGGWVEVYYYFNPCIHAHLGAAIDDPLDNEVSASQIVRNETCFTTWYWDVTKEFRLGLELSYRETSYASTLDNPGIIVQTLAGWKF